MFIIWHDNDFDFARWVYLNSELKNFQEDVYLRPIPKNNSSNLLIEKLKKKHEFNLLPVIKYETPDIVVQYVSSNERVSRILFVSEFMTHTPQHHHPLQRFARIYGASSLGIPNSLVLPAQKVKLERKNKDYKPVMYHTNPLIYDIFLRTSYVNNTSSLMFLWPERNGYLRTDKKHPTAPLLEGQIIDWIDFLNSCINGNSYRKSQIEFMLAHSNYPKVELTHQYLIEHFSDIYGLQTVEIIDTQEAINRFNLDHTILNNIFLNNKYSLIFSPQGLNPPSSTFRTDPYAGMLCAFDNLFCRNENGERSVNLILVAKDVHAVSLNFMRYSSNTMIDRKTGAPIIRQRSFSHDSEICPFLHFNLVDIEFEDLKDHLHTCPFTSNKQDRIYGIVSDIIVFDDIIYYNNERANYA